MSDCFQDLTAFYLALDTAQGIIYNPTPTPPHLPLTALTVVRRNTIFSCVSVSVFLIVSLMMISLSTTSCLIQVVSSCIISLARHPHVVSRCGSLHNLIPGMEIFGNTHPYRHEKSKYALKFARSIFSLALAAFLFLLIIPNTVFLRPQLA